MKKYLILLPFILLANCSGPAQPKDQEDGTNEAPEISGSTEASDSSTGDSAIRETKNVIYQGIVKPAGISIYQQGTHRLLLPDGRFILLESSSVDLNGYVDEQVELLGALRPTVEGAGTIMRVESAKLLAAQKPAETGSGITSTGSALPEDADTAPAEESATAPDTVNEVPEAEPKKEVTSEPEETKEDAGGNDTRPASVIPPSPGMEERTAKMSQESFAPEEWTQQYCTAHIGFCIPVHRNWWFKSFGTTTTYLWHVELNSEEIADLYDGPIHVNLISGAVTEADAQDKQVKSADGYLIGFRSWTDNRHFEIAAPKALGAAVRYITENLAEYLPKE